MTAPLLALCAIVKDEAHCITRTIASARPVVDHFTIVDTGSADDTVTVLRRLSEPMDVVTDGPFVDYAQARNLALDREASHPLRATFALSLSADETLCGDLAGMRGFLQRHVEHAADSEDALLVEVRTPSGAFDYPRVLRVKGAYRYVGEIHEQPVHPDGRKPAVKIPGCWIEYAPSDPTRLATRLRERDLPILRRQLAAAKPRTEARARALVLLAQTCEQIAAGAEDDVTKTQDTLAALGWYVIAGVQEGVFLAKWKALNVAETLGIYSGDEMLKRLRPLAAEDPKEPALAYMVAAATLGAASSPPVTRPGYRDVAQAAYKAAQTARDAVVDPMHPHDPHGLLWRPHLIAAVANRALGHGPAVKKSVEAGLSAGGPPEAFADFK